MTRMEHVKIPMRNRLGEVVAHALVDTADHPKVAHIRWHRSTIGNNTYVMARHDNRTVYLHRMVMDAPSGLQVDHINRNGLDNRRANLRLVTNAANRQNARPSPRRKVKSSKYRGVRWRKDRQKWEASATLDGRVYFLGRHEVEEDAADAARKFRLERMPFATD